MSISPPSPCPRCGGPRRWEEVQGARLEACPQCGAVTLTRAELFALMGRPLPFGGEARRATPAPAMARQTLLPLEEDDATAEAPPLPESVTGEVDAAPPSAGFEAPTAGPPPSVPPAGPAAAAAPANPPPAPPSLGATLRPSAAPTLMPAEEQEPGSQAGIANALSSQTWFDADAAGLSPPTDEVPTSFARSPDTEEVPTTAWTARPQALDGRHGFDDPPDSTQVSEDRRFVVDDEREEPGLGDLGVARGGARPETPFSARQTVELDAWKGGSPAGEDEWEAPTRRGPPWLVIGGVVVFGLGALVLLGAGLLGAGLWGSGVAPPAGPTAATPGLADAVAAGRSADVTVPPPADDRAARIQVEQDPVAPAASSPSAPAAPEPVNPAAPAPNKAPPAAKPAPTGSAARISQGWNVVGSDPAKAASLFQSVIAEESANAEARYGYGYALLQSGRSGEAVEHLCIAAAKGNTETRREVQGLLGRNDLVCP